MAEIGRLVPSHLLYSNPAAEAQYRRVRRMRRLENELRDMVDPASAWQLAGMDLPEDQMLSAVTQAANWVAVDKLITQMNAEPFEQRVTRWRGMTNSEQALLVNRGFTEPIKQQSSGLGGLIGGVKDAVLDTGGAVVGGVGSLLAGPFGPVLEAGGKALSGMIWAEDQVVGHPYRTIATQDADAAIVREQELQVRVARDVVEKRLNRQLSDQEWESIYAQFFEDNPTDYQPQYLGRFAANAPELGDFFGSSLIELSIGAATTNPSTFLVPDLDKQDVNIWQDRALASPVDPEVYDEFSRAMKELATTDEFGKGFTEAWQRTAHGEQYIDEEQQLAVMRSLEGDEPTRGYETFEVARVLAQGKDVEQFLAERYDPTSAEYAEKLNHYQTLYSTNKTFSDAIDSLAADAARVSVGRDVAASMGISESTPYLHDWVSGSTDALHILLFDPFLLAGRFVKAGRQFKWAADGMEGIGHARRGALAFRKASELGEGAHVLKPLTDRQLATASLRHSDNAKMLDVLEPRLAEKNIPVATLFDDAERPAQVLVDNIERYDSAVRKAIEDATPVARQTGDFTTVAKLHDLKFAIRDTLVIDPNRGGLRGVLDSYKGRAYNAQYRAAEVIADGLTGRISRWEFERQLPYVQRGLKPLMEYNRTLQSAGLGGIQSADDVFDFYQTVDGMMSIGSGNLTPSFLTDNVLDLPRITPGRSFARRITTGFEDHVLDTGINVGLPRRFVHSDLPEFDEFYGAFTKVARRDAAASRELANLTAGERALKVLTSPVRAVSKGIFATTHRNVGRVVTVTGPDAPADIRRLIDMSALAHVPKRRREAWYNQYMTGLGAADDAAELSAESVAMRIGMVRSILNESFQRAGVMDTAEGRHFVEEFWQKADVQRFAPKDYDLFPVGNTMQRMPVAPTAQYSFKLQLPAFNDLIVNQRRIGHFGQILGKLNRSPVDMIMNQAWKPLLLLRPGFIVRAAGEEAFAAFARNPLLFTNGILAAQVATNRRTGVGWMTEKMMRGDFARRYGRLPKMLEQVQLDDVARVGRADDVTEQIAKDMARRARAESFAYLEARKHDTWQAWMEADIKRFAGEYVPNQWDEIGYKAAHTASKVTDAIKRMKLAAIQGDAQKMTLITSLDDAGLARMRLVDKKKEFQELMPGIGHALHYSRAAQAMDQVTASGDIDAFMGMMDAANQIRPRTWKIKGDIYDANPQYIELGTARVYEAAKLAEDQAPELTWRVAAAYNHFLSEPVTPDALRVIVGRLTDEQLQLAGIGVLRQATEARALARVAATADEGVEALVEGFTKAELVEQAVKAGLPKSGTKRDIARRLSYKKAGLTPPKGSKLTWLDEAVVDPDDILAQLNDLQQRIPALFNSYDLRALKQTLEHGSVNLDDLAVGGEHLWPEITAYPRLHATMVRFPEGHPLEELAEKALGKSKYSPANHKEMADTLELLLNLEPDTAWAVLSGQPLRRMGVYDEMRDEIGEVVSREWNNNELMGQILHGHRPAFQDKMGRPVINPIASTDTRLYMPMIDVALLNEMRQQGTSEVLTAARQAGASDDTLALLARLLKEDSTKSTAQYLAAAQAVGKESALVPLSHFGFQNWQDADEVVRLLKTLNPNRAARVGSTDLMDPNRWQGLEHLKPRLVDDVDELGGRTAYRLPSHTLNDMVPLPEGQARTRVLPEPPVPEGHTRFYAKGSEAGDFEWTLVRPDDTAVPGRVEHSAIDAIDVLGENLKVEDLEFVRVNNSIRHRLNEPGVVQVGSTTWEENTSHIDAYVNTLLEYVAPRMSGELGAGQPLHRLIVPALDGEVSAATIRNIPISMLPDEVVVPAKFVVPHKNWWTRVKEQGFSKAINPAIDALVRRPLFFMNYAKGLQAAMPVIDMLKRPALYDDAARTITELTGSDDLDTFRTIWSNLDDTARYHMADGADFRDLLKDFVRMHDDDVPMVKELLAGSNKELNLLRRFGHHDQVVNETMAKVSVQRAVADTIPYIDDHAIRSYMQTYVQNLIPFQFAYEQFWKRWARTLVHSPSAVRRAQLIHHGLSSSGVIQQDANGEQVILIPLSETAGSLFAKASSYVFGHAYVPVPQMAMNVEQILPGIPGDLKQLPSLSPIAQVPALWAADQIPELRDGAGVFMGDVPIGTSRPLWQAFMPAYLNRIVSGTVSSIANPTDINNAMVDAMQLMEHESMRLQQEAEVASRAGDAELAQQLFARAAQLTPADFTDDPLAKEYYLDEMRGWSRSLLVFRGLLNFFMPATPQAQTPNAEDEVQFQQMLASGMDINDAQDLFFRRKGLEEVGDQDFTLNPDFVELLDDMSLEEAVAFYLAEKGQIYAPYTVFTTTKVSKAQLSPVEESVDWMIDNRAFMERYPMGAPWLMPPAPDDAEFSRQAWADMNAVGARAKKAPEDWYLGMKFQAAAETYFRERDSFELAMDRAGDDEYQRREMQAKWDAWAANYRRTHPVFDQQLQSTDRTRNERIIDDLTLALDDPAMPDAPHIRHLRTMITSYRTYRDQLNMLRGDRRKQAREQREQLRLAFSLWGEQYIASNPEAVSLWRTLIEPDADLSGVRKLQEDRERRRMVRA